MPASRPLSENIEDYLEAIHRMSETARGVSTTGLAQRLQVRAASVTGMLRRLTELGLIRYRPYRNIALTQEGERRAHEVIRRHRLVERLLSDLLHVPLEQTHQEACRLEHAVSSQLETYLAAALGSPASCPHGHPIDAAVDDRTIPLLEAPLHRQLTIARLNDESPEVVRYLRERNLLPRARVTLTLREPLGDAVVLKVAEQTHTLGYRLAASIRVERPKRRRSS